MGVEPPLPIGNEVELPTVYRYYRASDKRLLYVGKTVNPGRRGREHRDGKHWWRDVGLVVYEHLPVGATRDDLDRAERRAIGRGWPLENKQHNPRAKRWLEDQYPDATDEHVFSYELVERFARYKPSTTGPVPLTQAQHRAAGGRIEVDRYPEVSRSGRDYGRYSPARQITLTLGQLVVLVAAPLAVIVILTIALMLAVG
jgi:hypothetical protein